MIDLQKNANLKLIPFYTDNPGSKNSYTLYIDANKKDIFKAESKQVSAPKFTLMFLVFYVFFQMFSIDIIPFDNLFAFFIICLFVFILGLICGIYLKQKMIDNIRKVTLTVMEWERCLKKGNHFYPRQMLFTIILIILSGACFVFLYIYPSKWWFFGGDRLKHIGRGANGGFIEN